MELLDIVLLEMNPEDFYPEHDYSLDARFFMWQRLLQDHPEWTSMWTSDSFDSTVFKNPCNHSLLPSGHIYVQEEVKETLVDTYINHRFWVVGGKYEKFWESDLAPNNRTWPILNCGLLGGARSIMLEFFAALSPVLIDLSVKKRLKEMDVGYDQGFCMVFFNYVLYQPEWRTRVRSGAPFHSVFKGYEFGRTDVVFRHK